MIYDPANGEYTPSVRTYHPRTCFLMTQLGKPVPQTITKIRAKIKKLLDDMNYALLDAGSKVTGRDFLNKIWGMILSVPIGVAIVDREMKPTAIQNVFYEIGLMQAYGKETIVIKTRGTKVPSDFVRTEYIEYSQDGRLFSREFRKFMKDCEERANHYVLMAEELRNNLVLAFDYYRRAYLITGAGTYAWLAKKLLSEGKGGPVCPTMVREPVVNYITEGWMV